jgi:hypothetical protein
MAELTREQAAKLRHMEQMSMRLLFAVMACFLTLVSCCSAEVMYLFQVANWQVGAYLDRQRSLVQSLWEIRNPLLPVGCRPICVCPA